MFRFRFLSQRASDNFLPDSQSETFWPGFGPLRASLITLNLVAGTKEGLLLRGIVNQSGIES